MATTTTTKRQRDQIIEVLEEYLSTHGPEVQQLLEQSHAANREEQSRLEQQARLIQQREWYGEPEPQVDTRPRVVCVKRFQDRGQWIEPGSIWLASHETVQAAASAFEPVQD